MFSITRYINKYFILSVSFIFYMLTLAPTIIGGDSARFCVFVHNFELYFSKAHDHPLYTLIGKLFSLLPFELAHSLNLMSAVFGALTVFLVYIFVFSITKSKLAAIFSSMALMVSHAFWLHSVIAEVYTINTVFVLLLVLTATSIQSGKKKIIYFIIIFSVGLLNHLILILTIPAFFIYYLLQLKKAERKRILKIATWFVFFFILFVTISFLIDYDKTKSIIKAVLLGPPSILVYVLPPTDFILFIQEIIFYFLYLFYQFPFLTILIGFIGIIKFYQQDRNKALLILLLIFFNAFFFIKTTLWSSYGGTKYTFYIVDYVLFSIFVGYGFYYLVNNFIKHSYIKSILFSSILITIIFYSTMPYITSYLNIDLISARDFPYRDSNRFFLNPNKAGYYGDRKIGEVILREAKYNSVIFADFTIYTILKYLKEVEDKRPDISLVQSEGKVLVKWINEIKSNDPDKNIYIAVTSLDNPSEYYNLSGLDKNYSFKKYNVLFEVIDINRKDVL